MIDRFIVRRLLLSAATGLALAVAGVSAPIVAGSLTPAMAQSTDDFNAALDAYGHWLRHAPYGEVWVPDGVPRDRRPYEYGHRVYTDDWGWYWVSDHQEADWGWVTYHYGRWAHDPRLGWFGCRATNGRRPGSTGATAATTSAGRRCRPMTRSTPMTRMRTTGGSCRCATSASRSCAATLCGATVHILMRDTRIINRPVHIEGRRVWVNPGLAPGFIAGRTHVTLHAYNVRPRVFGTTAGVQGAVTVRRDQLHKKGDIRRVARVTIQRTTTAIAPTATCRRRNRSARASAANSAAIRRVPRKEALFRRRRKVSRRKANRKSVRPVSRQRRGRQ